MRILETYHMPGSVEVLSMDEFIRLEANMQASRGAALVIMVCFVLYSSRWSGLLHCAFRLLCCFTWRLALLHS